MRPAGDEADGVAEAGGLPTLRGPRVTLRPGSEADVPALAAVFAAPEVRRWWPATEAEVVSLATNGDPGVEVWLVELGGAVVGVIQAYEETDPQYRHAGIDLSLAPAVHGRGIGPEAIRVLARHLFARGHHRLVIDPNAANARAIRAYEKVGFRAVGVLRRYEWDATFGAWTDGLLMDLLADELTPDPVSAEG